MFGRESEEKMGKQLTNSLREAWKHPFELELGPGRLLSVEREKRRGDSVSISSSLYGIDIKIVAKWFG